MKYIPDFFNPAHTGKHPTNSLPDYVSSILYLPKVIFGLSFICGTVLLLLYLITHQTGLVILGFYYVYCATAFNLLILAVMIVLGLYYQKYFLLILQKTSILLINIPIAIGYFYLLTYLDMLL